MQILLLLHIKHLKYVQYSEERESKIIVAIETPGGKRNLNININAQQGIIKAYVSKQFKT